MELTHEENDQVLRRREKLQTLREMGIDPYREERYERTHLAADILNGYDELEGKTVRIAGRIVAMRLMGKASFMHLQDGSDKIQIYLRADDLGEQRYGLLKLLDLGDFLGVQGEVFRTKTGEITVHVREFTILSKALRPIPFGKEKGEQHWYGLQDVELRYRRRYLDLLVNRESRQILLDRCRIVQATRRFLDNEGFLEVETPVLQPLAGGAAARPFLTHHNALDVDFHLRISLELYLKRLIVGNIEKVYEIGRVFRNEGMDRRHNPEYTLLELYQAYANLEDIMDLVERLFYHVCLEVRGEPFIEYNGQKVDMTPPWKRGRLLDLIEYYAGVKPEEFATLESAKAAMERKGLPTENEHTVGGIIEKLLERFVQPNLVEPTFVTDYPIETSPLAKKHPQDPRFTRRFEGYVACQEVANAFSELNDPDDQRERFEAQMRMRAAGDEEAHPYDEDFVTALEYGMPPTGGLGIGMDRMAMVILGADSIQDVIFFPQMRPKP
ncbi:MAG: lysine--tRNA ligase [Armatimonadota bacterium]|nr:MAG: lysine--tRNA ligase [Armatimonadota bacterium]